MGANTSLPAFLSAKPSKQSHRLSKFRNKNKLQNVDHDAMDEVNLLMDKWRPSDVLILMRKFKQQARLQHGNCNENNNNSNNISKKSSRIRKNSIGSDEEDEANYLQEIREESVPLTLDLEGFCQIFSELDHMPQDLAKAAFKLFCKEGDTMDFREFCTAITICCYGSAEKKGSIIFNLFDSDKDGFLTPEDVEELARTTMASMERLESEDRASSRTSWMRKAGQELLNDLSKSQNKISLQEFLSWAEKNMIITYLLELFRIVPTSEIEARTVKKILKKQNEMKLNEVWHVLSSKWWGTWCMYTSYRAFDFAHDETQNNNIVNTPSRSINRKNNDDDSDDKCGKNNVLESSTGVSDIQMNDTNIVSPYFSPEIKPNDENHVNMDELNLKNTIVDSYANPRTLFDKSPSSSSRNTRNSLVRSRSLSYTSGDRPGPFDNYHLEGDMKGTLKLNLLEGHDYVLIPDTLWKHLQNWYGGGPDYSRNVISLKGAKGAKNRRTPYYNPPERDGVVLEMHPLVLIFASMDVRSGRPSKGAKEFRKIFSLVNTVKYMKKEVCEHLNVVPEYSRLWLKPKGGEWRCLSIYCNNDDDNIGENSRPGYETGDDGEMEQVSLADADIETGDFIMIETKENGADVWPRDLIEEQHENFRDFELNSRVDAKDKDNKWFAGTVVDLERDEDNENVTEVKIHFDRFNSKWDEWYNVNSPKLKPLYTITEPRSDNVGLNGSDRKNRVSGNAVERGAVGLINLGNTCYMNSVLQCLSNTPMLCNYFRTGLFEKELNVSNKRGSGGEVAFELSKVLSKLWIDQSISPVKAIAPKKFKRTFAKTPMLTPFSGYGQQDAHEFFSVLLDIVHEDINRVMLTKKKENEKYNGSEIIKANASSSNKRNGKKKRLTAFKASATSPQGKTQSSDVKEKKNNNSLPLEIHGTSSSSSTEFIELQNGNSKLKSQGKNKIQMQQQDIQVPPIIDDKLQNKSNEKGESDIVDDLLNKSIQNVPNDTKKLSKTIMEALSDAELADNKWKEHLEENRSTIVDLFHGQLRRTLKCNSCGHKSLNFEPFHCLSVALNVRFAYNTVVIPLPKKHDERDNSEKMLGNSALAAKRTVYGVFTPQVGLVGDLKFELASLCKIPADRLIIATVENNMTVTIRPDRQHLHTIREDDTLYAFERPLTFNEIFGHPSVEINNIPVKTNGSTKVSNDYSENNIVVGNKTSLCCCYPFYSMRNDDVGDNTNKISGNNTNVQNSGIDEEDEGSLQNNYMEDEREGVEMTTTGSKKKISCNTAGNDNLQEEENYSSVTETFMHQRIDCLDADRHWYAATVVAVNEETEEIKVRFDGYKSTFDEWVNYNEDYRIKPLYSVVTKPPLELVVVTLLHRTVQKPQKTKEVVESGLEMISNELDALSSSKNVNNNNNVARYFGTPSLLHFSSHVSNAELLNIVDRHVSNCINKSKKIFSGIKPYTVHINNLEKKTNWRQVENHPGLPIVRSGESIVVEWDDIESYDENVDKYIDHETVQKVKGARMQEQANGRKNIKLEDCLKDFSKPERLGEGYKCDGCKNVDTTTSKLDIWRLPDILVLHVKRFIYTMYVRGKLNNPMVYPLKNLDMSTVLGRREADDFRDRELFNLYGVVHHMGSMGGGHYIATCKNAPTKEADTKEAWFEYNDSRVESISDDDVVRSSGYLLFYHRKQLSAHNIINLSNPM
jgi:ubiquitin C-terminal hydrolase/Ca2+-binding EF-hand superfamily protein